MLIGAGATVVAKRTRSNGCTGGAVRILLDILLWILGVPASVLFLIFLMRGCT